MEFIPVPENQTLPMCHLSLSYPDKSYMVHKSYSGLIFTFSLKPGKICFHFADCMSSHYLQAKLLAARKGPYLCVNGRKCTVKRDVGCNFIT